MNVVPLGGVLTSTAGSPLQQIRGKDADRTAQDVNNQQRSDKLGNHADAAAGVGETEEDQGVADRDADGRKMWERSPDGESHARDEQETDEQESKEQHKAKDPTGTAGNSLDLTG